ncbi:MAG: organomercurial lyase [Candidatus Dormibacteraceae bacterium]
MRRVPVPPPTTMLKPLIDFETLVRTVAFQLMVTRAEAIAPETLGEAAGIRLDQLATLLDQLDRAGRIRRDGMGRVVGSAGLSIIPDRHEIEVEGRQFWTWCAYDILGIFGALAASGRALSPSPPDGNLIEVRFVGGRPQQSTAMLFRPEADSMSCCENVYEQWCPNSNLFASRQLAEAWAAEHGLVGQVFSLDEAADLATEEWKPLTETLTLKRK